MTDWTTADIPPLNGKTAVITGATGGLGHETALALAAAGAMVVLTGRNDAKGRNAIHASDSAENARREVGFFFPEGELAGLWG